MKSIRRNNRRSTLFTFSIDRLAPAVLTGMIFLSVVFLVQDTSISKNEIDTVATMQQSDGTRTPVLTPEELLRKIGVKSVTGISLEMFFLSVVDSAVAMEYTSLVMKYATENNLAPELVAGIIMRESFGDSLALGQPFRLRINGEVISTRAIGLMQIVEPLWLGVYPECGDDLFSAETNICYGSNIYKYFLDGTKGNHSRALVAYSGNAKLYADMVFEYTGRVVAERSF